MHQAELDILKQSISNNARVLYCLVLRPSAHQSTGISAPLNFKQIKEILNNGGGKIALGREINELLLELIACELLAPITELDDKGSLNGAQFNLPKMQDTQHSNMHQIRNKMTPDWQPNDKFFQEISQLVGLIQKDYASEELGEFIAYWMGKPEQQLSSWQWTQKFILSLRKNRQIKGYNPTSIVGYQQIENQPEVVIDEKTRQLIDKYHGKS
jgi:hypothetical protein